MRQVIVNGLGLVDSSVVDRIPVRLQNDTAFRAGLNIIRLKWDLKIMTGGAVRFFFELNAAFITKGLFLAGSLLNGDELTLMVYNLGEDGTSEIYAASSTILAYAIPYETVQLRVFAGEMSGVVLIPSE